MKKLALFLSFLFVISCSKDPIIYTLTTSANPAEGGTVIPSTQQFEEGETVAITASPSSDYVFQSWSGAATGSTISTSVVMNSDKTVTANFVKKKFVLTISVEGEGTVTEKIIKAGSATDYTIGSVIELTATGKTGWEFKEWKADLTGTENPKEITIDASKTVKAVFVKKQFAVNITIEGEGGGTVAEEVVEGLKVDSKYEYGTELKLTAKPSAEWEFSSWKEDLEGTENPQTITIDNIKAVTAVFIKKKYALTIEVEGQGKVAEEVIKAGAATDYNSGTIVELTASTGEEGWEFKEWTGDLTGTDNPAQITVVGGAKTVKAVFVKKQFAINITIEGEGGGTVAEEVVTGLKVDSKYEYGTELKLTANPSSEWVFKEWKGDVTGTENPLQLTIDETKNVTAVFIENFFIYLPFNGSVNDESINNFEIDSNGVELTSDRHGNENSAYLISNGNSGSSGSGAGDLIFSKQNIFTNSLENYTISFWVNFLSNSGSQMVFGLLGGTPDTNGSGGDAFNYKGNTLSNYRSTHTESTGWDVLARSTYGTLDINKWYNVSLIRDGDNLFYYLNGEKVKTITGLNNYDFENKKTRLKIGNNTYNYKNGEWTSYIEQMKGKIDEVIIWERSLSENEIKEIYNR